MNIQDCIDNKIDFELLQRPYSVMLGLQTSKGAKSPALWNKCLKGTSAMLCCDVSSNSNLISLYNLLQSDPNCVGGAVTAPYKTQIFDLCNNKSELAKRIGTCNNFYRDSTIPLGFTIDNTDALGFLKAFSISTREKSFSNYIILGAGAVSRSIRESLLSSTKDTASVYTLSRGSGLESRNIYTYDTFYEFLAGKPLDDCCVINATSVGDYTNPDASLLEEVPILSNILDSIGVAYFFDSIHTPSSTPLQLRYHPYSSNGKLMNVYQAVIGFTNVYPHFSQEFALQTMQSF